MTFVTLSLFYSLYNYEEINIFYRLEKNYNSKKYFDKKFKKV